MQDRISTAELGKVNPHIGSDTQALWRATADAHGGLERWARVDSISARLNSGGFAFTSHFQGRALRHLSIRVAPHRREVVLHDFVQPGWRGVWRPDQVSIYDSDHKRVSQREHPRAQFSRPIKFLVWDSLDILYFAGYALWNYLSFPYLLGLSGISLTSAASAARQASCQLQAQFAPELATHSPYQCFHLSPQLHLVQHDYTADVIGSWATAANLCQASEVVQGLRFYTRRKVLPRQREDFLLPFPTMVWIEIDDLQVHFAPPNPVPAD